MLFRYAHQSQMHPDLSAVPAPRQSHYPQTVPDIPLPQHWQAAAYPGHCRTGIRLLFPIHDPDRVRYTPSDLRRSVHSAPQ